MGSNGSKTGEIPEDELAEGSVPSTPILTPKINKPVDEIVDPRSPTANIIRTPIQFEPLSNKLDNQNNTPAKVLLGIDPRSPTVDFERTPIYVPDQQLPKLRNKNFDKVLRGVQTNPELKHIKNNNEQEKSLVKPKLLESSPITANRDAYKRKSFVGLLETNIDFTETDLDAVILNKSFNKSFNKENTQTDVPTTPKPDSNVVKRIIDIVKTQNIDPRSPTTDFVRTPIQIVKKVGELHLNVAEEIESNSESECLNDSCLPVNSPDEVEDTIEVSNKLETSSELTAEVQTNVVSDLGIQTTSISNKINQKTNIVDVAVQTSCIEDAFEQVKNVAIVTCNTENEKESPNYNNRYKTPTRQNINLTAEVKDFDKKLTSLIYHDESDSNVVVPVVNKIIIKENVRTPLGSRSGNSVNEPKRTSNKLKVSDKPRRSLSKIPVLRDKNGKKIQCENTPPRLKNPRQIGAVRKSHWDGDNTLVI